MIKFGGGGQDNNKKADNKSTGPTGTPTDRTGVTGLIGSKTGLISVSI